MPLTKEQFQKARDAGYSVEQIAEFENRRKSEQPQQQPTQQPAKPTNILQQLLGGWNQTANILNPESIANKTVGGIVGGMVEPPIKMVGRAGQTIESMISGKPPQNYTIPLPSLVGGNISIEPPQTMGQVVGPAVGTALSLSAIKGAMNPKGISNIVKFDDALTQATQTKKAIDTVRTTLGQAKQIALQEAKDIKIKEFDWGELPKKALDVITNSKDIYGVEFEASGRPVQTIGNLDKIKTALQDLTSTKDYIEAGNMEKRQIMQFAGKVRDAMVSATKKAGKPELGEALKNYHNFMEDYELANSKLVNFMGQAEANKLKSIFKVGAEPLVKQAFDRIAKSSPELKSIISSRKNRELLKSLLSTKNLTRAAVGSAAIEGSKKVITGRW